MKSPSPKSDMLGEVTFAPATNRDDLAALARAASVLADGDPRWAARLVDSYLRGSALGGRGRLIPGRRRAVSVVGVRPSLPGGALLAAKRATLRLVPSC